MYLSHLLEASFGNEKMPKVNKLMQIKNELEENSLLITCSYSMLGIGPNMPQARRSSSCGGPVPVSSFQKAYDLPTMPAA